MDYGVTSNFTTKSQSIVVDGKVRNVADCHLVVAIIFGVHPVFHHARLTFTDYVRANSVS